MNIYTYCQGDPIGNTDPSGHWSKDLHMDKTKEWAKDSGFTKSQAAIIGYYDNQVDKVLGITSGKPFDGIPGSWGDDWHFNMNGGKGIDTRLIHSKKEYQLAVALWNEAQKSQFKTNLENEALTHLGKALHPLQDIYAHGPVTTMKQHNSFVDPKTGKAVIDNMGYNVDFKTGIVSAGNTRYNNTEIATKKMLEQFLKDTNQKK